MADEASWEDDWQARVYARVRSRGFDTVTAFAEASPRATLFELVDELGSENVNVSQLVALMREEAERTGSVDRFGRGLLVHELWELIPKGWRVNPGDGFEFDFKVASALASAHKGVRSSPRVEALAETHHNSCSRIMGFTMLYHPTAALVERGEA